MKFSASYPVLPMDSEEDKVQREQAALINLFNMLIQSNLIERSEGEEFFNGGFVKKVNLTLTIPDQNETITVEKQRRIDPEGNEPLTGGCESCSN